MSGGTRAGAGRKAVSIDLETLEKLCSMGCSDEELAGWFGVSVRTIQNRRTQRKFADVMRRGDARGRISIRRAQVRQVEAGNVPMIIWMGKNRLGQRDNVACISMSLPPIKTAQDVADAAEEVTQAIACGRISPVQGESLMRVLDMRSRIIADVQTVSRIEKLEEDWTAANLLPRAA
jgi:hypothetical protein